MTLRHIDNELAHLERILPHIRRGPLPMSYWQSRIDAFEDFSLIPQQRHRVERLQKLLGGIERVRLAA